MIELRSEISGFYKGLIYCYSLEQAWQVAKIIETVVKNKIGSGIPVTVKRGCSEYPIAFPDYKKITKSGAQQMNYNEDWKAIEEDYDSKNLTNYKGNILPSISALSLSDILIIRNWIDYAKGIGDLSARPLHQNRATSENIFKVAENRLEKYRWLEPF